MLIVIATVELAPGQRDAFLDEFRKVVPHVLGETGCIEYGATIDTPTNIPTQDQVREDEVVIVEKWQNLQALEAHLNAAHMKEYRDRVRDLVQKVSLRILQPA